MSYAAYTIKCSVCHKLVRVPYIPRKGYSCRQCTEPKKRLYI